MKIIGDTHGIRPLFQIIDNQKLENQNLIHVGDFGLGFEEITNDVRNLLLLDECLLDTNNILYVIRGNHDNPIFWDKSKGLNLPKFHNIHLVDDYSVITIEDKNVLFVGGALSIDRIPRKRDYPYVSWWKDEEFKYDPVKLDTVMTKHQNIDIVITHTAPDFIYPTNDNVQIVNHYHELEMAHGVDLKAELKIERQNMTEMFNDIILGYKKRPKHWFYGHFHTNRTFIVNVGENEDMEFHLLNVNEIYDLK